MLRVRVRVNAQALDVYPAITHKQLGINSSLLLLSEKH